MAQRNFLILLAVVALGVWWFTRNQTPTKETDNKTTTTTIEETGTSTDSKKEDTKETGSSEEKKDEKGEGNTLGLTGTFTHKAYGYIVLFPSSWNWNGTQVHTLVLSSERISANSEALTKNNLKILRADQPTPEGDVVAKSLGTAGGAEFRAVYLKDHNYPEVIAEILSSFAVKNTAAVTL